MKKVMIIVVALLIVGALVGVSVMKGEEIKKMLKGKEVEHYSKPLEILTNMGMGTENEEFLKSKVTISTLDKKLYKKMDYEYSTPIQDILVTYLNSQSPEYLTNPKNRDEMKETIKKIIEKELHIDIEGVYFVDFTVQR